MSVQPQVEPFIARLVELQGEQSDGVFADRLGIHRASWNKLKRGVVTPAGGKVIRQALSLYPELAPLLAPSEQIRNNLGARNV